MGRIGGAIGLGVVLGPGVGGLLAARSLAAPFFIASGFCLLTFLIILLGLPESLSKENRRESVEIKFMQIRGLWQALYTPMGFGLIVAFAAIFGQTIFSSIFGLYALERFSYGPEQVGTIMVAMGLMYAVSQGLVVGPLTRRFGDEKIMAWALMGCSLGYVLMLLSKTFITILLAISCFILVNSLLKPAALSCVSKKVTEKQGQAMGIAESYMSLGRIIGPLWGGMIFDVNIFYPFISGALIFLIMFIITMGKAKSSSKLEEVKC